MQKRPTYIFMIAAALLGGFFFSCEEKGPVIDLSDAVIDTTYVVSQVEMPQQKNVLLEEFTGVRCTNCPKGHEVIKQLEAQHGERFITVSAHSEFLANPYDGDQDLRVQDAQDLEDLLGPISSKPSGSIDRKKFSGETSLVHFRQKWSSFVNQQLLLTTPVNLYIETDFAAAGRILEITTTVMYTSDVSEVNKISVMILEDDIIAAQMDDGVIDSFYRQDNVLRKIITPVTGLGLNAVLEKGRVIIKGYSVEIPQAWDIDNLRVIALVHNANEVLQVIEENVN